MTFGCFCAVSIATSNSSLCALTNFDLSLVDNPPKPFSCAFAGAWAFSVTPAILNSSANVELSGVFGLGDVTNCPLADVILFL